MSRHAALPISLYVEGRTVVVVGDGDSSDRRARRFEAAGATVRRVSPASFGSEHCEGAFIVAFQEPVEGGADTARAAGTLVYVHDQPAVSDVAMPGLAQRGPLKLAISTDGAAPALTRRLRQQLEKLLDAAGPDLDALIEELESLRGKATAAQLNELAARLTIAGKIEIESS
jgi:precorrin-2 dehydrogenase/sirohydrochlorin ferrochelatase